MNVQRACPGCGAAAPRADSVFCEFCGARLSRAETPRVEEPSEDVAARLRALESHPDLESILRRKPRTTSPVQVARGIAFLITFVLFSVLLSLLSAAFFPPLALVPLAAVVIALYALASTLARQRGARRFPLERRPAIVANLRTRIHAGGDSVGRAHHVTTLVFSGGEEHEYRAQEDPANRLAIGTPGVAFLRGSSLVDFEPLAAMTLDAPGREDSSS